jgi:hypothetical protein
MMDIQKKISVVVLMKTYGLIIYWGQNFIFTPTVLLHYFRYMYMSKTFSAVSQPNGQLLIHKRYRDGSKYVGFLTLFGTRVWSITYQTGLWPVATRRPILRCWWWIHEQHAILPDF